MRDPSYDMSLGEASAFTVGAAVVGVFFALSMAGVGCLSGRELFLEEIAYAAGILPLNIVLFYVVPAIWRAATPRRQTRRWTKWRQQQELEKERIRNIEFFKVSR